MSRKEAPRFHPSMKDQIPEVPEGMVLAKFYGEPVFIPAIKLGEAMYGKSPYSVRQVDYLSKLQEERLRADKKIELSQERELREPNLLAERFGERYKLFDCEYPENTDKSLSDREKNLAFVALPLDRDAAVYTDRMIRLLGNIFDLSVIGSSELSDNEVRRMTRIVDVMGINTYSMLCELGHSEKAKEIVAIHRDRMKRWEVCRNYEI